MARAKYQGADAVVKRFEEMAVNYATDRYMNHDDGGWTYGLIGEFPENGLVPTAYLYALLGVSAGYDGLTFAPDFSTAYNRMGVESVVYGGKAYKLEAQKSGRMVIVGQSGLDMILNAKPAKAAEEYKVVVKSGLNGQTIGSKNCTPDENGFLHLDFTGSNAQTSSVRVEITVA